MKTIVITGASDGIGRAAAQELHALGHNVVLIGRNPEKTKAAADELSAPYYVADFADLHQVARLADALKKDLERIDVLILNAGGIFDQRTITKDGFEQTFQVNHLAHFMLTNRLLPALTKNKATVIATSSAANFMNRLDLDDLNAEKSYRKWTVYGNAKLMNILFIRELARRFGGKGITTAAFHPGVVASSFSRELGPFLKFIFNSKLTRVFGLVVTPKQGADTMIWLATREPGKVWKSGEYYSRRKQKRAAGKAYDPLLANDLWNKSEDLIMDSLNY